MLKVSKISRLKDMETAFEIRRKVFVEEQQVPPDEEYDEFEESSIHFLAQHNGISAGTARWRKTENGIKLERFAVLKEFRGKGVGSALVEAVLADLPETEGQIYLHSQEHAMPLYARFGFAPVGERFFECEMPHFKMIIRKG